MRLHNARLPCAAPYGQRIAMLLNSPHDEYATMVAYMGLDRKEFHSTGLQAEMRQDVTAGRPQSIPPSVGKTGFLPGWVETMGLSCPTRSAPCPRPRMLARYEEIILVSRSCRISPMANVDSRPPQRRRPRRRNKVFGTRAKRRASAPKPPAGRRQPASWVPVRQRLQPAKQAMGTRHEGLLRPRDVSLEQLHRFSALPRSTMAIRADGTTRMVRYVLHVHACAAAPPPGVPAAPPNPRSKACSETEDFASAGRMGWHLRQARSVPLRSNDAIGSSRCTKNIPPWLAPSLHVTTARHGSGGMHMAILGIILAKSAETMRLQHPEQLALLSGFVKAGALGMNVGTASCAWPAVTA